jgi:hypothetical protein
MQAHECQLREDYFGYRVTCTICGRTKAPQGRSVPDALYGSICRMECPGFYEEPLPSNLWPNESEASFGYKVTR